VSFYQICIFVCVRGTEGQTGCRTLFSPQIETFNLHDFVGLYPSHLLRELTQAVAVVKMSWYVRETIVAYSKLFTCDVMVLSQSALFHGQHLRYNFLQLFPAESAKFASDVTSIRSVARSSL
jgi:hypothetical protein